MTKRTLFPLIALATCTLLAGYASAQSDANSTAPATAPDNSKSNKSDQSNMSATADTQSNHSSDVDLTKRIRQSVVADKSLSTYAHNIKIVTLNGSVTLNGVVRSDEEKNAVEMKAAAIAGKDKVTNALKVSPAN
ncbi:MAG TPA: BON domain-containing protein [Bryobacteraceae bacterium]|nr:BON domain-containing protein [Bryobacteraceae bacterium]